MGEACRLLGGGLGLLRSTHIASSLDYIYLCARTYVRTQEAHMHLQSLEDNKCVIL